ncbi:hypothetical protein OG782_20950 [Streptomyces sp. NBC_00876]|uniref:hypothetical protein n=1 Tax=Streptomyces sp. NBC_00876 TaxID=2975853 RepID=UPI00386EEA65|nr:hypothetical protein OG782_20950 [Streptomyces sp. NBC_00876]
MTSPGNWGHGDPSLKSQGDNNNIIGNAGTFNQFQILIRRASFVTGWLFLILSVLLAGYATWKWPGGSRNQYVGFFAFLLLAFLASVVHISLRRADRSGATGTGGPAGRKGSGLRLPDLLLIVSLVCALISWWSFQNVVRNGEVDVLVRTQGAQALTNEPDSALVLTVAPSKAADRRGRLRLTLELGEYDAGAPACSHRTRVRLTALSESVTPLVSDLPARSTTDFDLGGLMQPNGVTFELKVQTPQGCTLRLVNKQATLHND